jgi:hypothetical protein
MLERDASFDDAVLDEVSRLRGLDLGSAEHVQNMFGRKCRRNEHVHDMFVDSGALAAAQAALGERLTTATPAPDEGRAVMRARGVLERKRADDALPLLPELGPRLSQHDALALGKIRETPRLSQKTAIADAMRIAESALARGDLASFAARDLAMLRKRFSPWWRMFG